MHQNYDAVLVWSGVALLVVLAAVRRSWVVHGRSRPSPPFSALDFQGYPDVYPLLPDAALGIGGAVALAAAAASGARSLALAVLAASAWTQFAPGDGLAARAPRRRASSGCSGRETPGTRSATRRRLVLSGRSNASR